VTLVGRFSALGIPLILAVAALLLLVGGEAGLIVQFVFGKLVFSTSNGAALYLISYCLLALWRRRATGAANPRWLAAFLAALLVGHALNLWITLGYLSEMAIPAGAHVYHWRDDHYSFTSLFHSHLGKTAFAVVARLVDWAPSGAYDGGDVFLNWVPVWASWCIGLSFVIALVASLAALPALARRLPPAHSALFVLASAVALRGMIDGGPLAAGIPPAFASIAWISLRKSETAQPAPLYLLLTAIVLTAYLALWIGLSPEFPALGGFIFPASLFVWLALAGAHRAMAGRMALVAVLAASLALDAESNLLPLVLPPSSACRAIRLSTPQPVEHACDGRTVFATYALLGQDPRKANTILLAQRPDLGTSKLSGRILPVDARVAHFAIPPSGTWQQIDLAPMTLRGGWLAFSATARDGLPPILAAGEPSVIGHNNFNVYLWELARSFSKGGFSEFVLLPDTQGNLSLGQGSGSLEGIAQGLKQQGSMTIRGFTQAGRN
jgi:hypothetical protein